MRLLKHASRPGRGLLYPGFLLLMVLAGIAALLHGQGRLYFGPADSDLVNQFYPWRVFLVRWLHRGVFPLWDPHVFDGYPVIETQQMGLLYPVSIFSTLLFSPRMGLLVMMAVHLAIGALGSYLGLRRAWRLSPQAAVLGSAVYVFGAVFSIRVAAGHFTVVAVMAWWPWAYFSLYRGVRLCQARLWSRPGSTPQALSPGTGKRRLMHELRQLLANLAGVIALPEARSWLLLSALASAMTVLAGGPQYVVYLFWIEVCTLLCLLRRRHWLSGLGLLGAVWSLAALLSCPQWLPTLKYLPFTGRGGGMPGLGELIARSDAINMLLELFLPFPFGDDMRHAHLHFKNVWETTSYPGALTLVFAFCLGLRALKSRRFGSPHVRSALALVLLGFYLSWGGWLPGFGSFRETLKARAIIAFAVSLCAALELEQLRKAQTGARALEIAVAAFFALLAGGASLAASLHAQSFGRYFMHFGPPFDPAASEQWKQAVANPALASRQFIAASACVAATCLAAALLMLFLRPKTSPATRRLAIAALVLLGSLEPVSHHLYAYYSHNPFDAVELPAQLVKQMVPRIEATRRDQQPPWRVSYHPILANRSHLLDSLWETAGYDPLMPREANTRISLGGPREDRPTSQIVRLASLAIARRYELTGWDPRSTQPLEGSKAFTEPAPEAALLSVERNVAAGIPSLDYFGPTLDGTSFVAPAEHAGKMVSAEALPAEFRKQLDAIHAAAGESSSSLALGESLRMLPGRTPNVYGVEVRLNKPALVLLRMSWLPGWQVSIDQGAPQKTLFANNWMPAALVDAGAHQVIFRYRPVHFYPALAVAAVGCLAMLGMVTVPGRRKRGRGKA